MTVYLRLPVIRFTASLLPARPGEPTELEQAILFYMLSRGAGADFDDIRAFTGLGPNMLTEILIAFINRRWVIINKGDLRVAEKVSRLLDAGEGGIGQLGTTEAGHRFTLWYDPIGGGVASFRESFLSMGGEEWDTVPATWPDPDHPDRMTFWDGRPLDGYLHDPEIQRKVLNALRSDRNARPLLENRDRSLSIEVEGPYRGRELSQHIRYCTIAFGVFADEEEGADRFRLECTDRRHIGLARLGRLAAPMIPPIARRAVDMDRPELLSLLRKSARRRGVAPVPVFSPFDRLTAALRASDDIRAGEDIIEFWYEVESALGTTLASRIDFSCSGCHPQAPPEILLPALLETAPDRCVLVAPKIVADRAQAPLAALADWQRQGAGRGIAVASPDHADHGRQSEGTRAVADELGPDGLLSSGPRQPFLDTPAMLRGDDAIALFDAQPLAAQRVGALMLHVRDTDGENGAIGALHETLPFLRPATRERRQRDTRADDRAALPPAVAQVVESIGTDLRSGLQTLQEQGEIESVIERIVWLRDWRDGHSESFELLTGARIADSARSILRNTPPQGGMAMGIVGPGDAGMAAEIPRLVRNRLNAGHDQHGTAGRMVVILPEGRNAAFDTVAAELAEDFASLHGEAASAGHRVIMAKMPSGGDALPGFVAGPGTLVIAADGLLSAGTARTGVALRPGIRMGLVLRGCRARRLGLDYLRRFYPDLDDALRDEPEDPLRDPPVASRRIDHVAGLWDGWKDDGNRGATAARAWLEESEGVRGYRAVIGLLERAGKTPEQTYAILKAAASMERDAVEGARGALADLALRCVDDRRLAAAALLADHLPDGHWLRDPLARRLAFCLARRIEPDLSDDEMMALADPSAAVEALAVLLVLDGLGGGMAAFADYVVHGPRDARPDSAVAALSAVAAPGRVLDLAGAAGRDSDDRIDTVIRDLRTRLDTLHERAQIRRGVHKSVHALRMQLFVDGDAFFSRLRAALAEPVDRKRLEAVLRDRDGLLGVDVLGSLAADRPSLNVTELGDAYRLSAHDAMVARTGLEPVNEHLTGRDIRTVLRTLFDIVVNRLAPLMAEGVAGLADTAAMIARASDRLDGPQAWLGAVLRDRLADTSATLALEEPRWLMPKVGNGICHDTGWGDGLARFFGKEFSPDARLSDVIRWYFSHESDFDPSNRDRLDLYGVYGELTVPLVLERDARADVRQGLIESNARYGDWIETLDAFAAIADSAGLRGDAAGLRQLLAESRDATGAAEGAMDDDTLDYAVLWSAELAQASFGAEKNFQRTLDGLFAGEAEQLLPTQASRAVRKNAFDRARKGPQAACREMSTLADYLRWHENDGTAVKICCSRGFLRRFDRSDAPSTERDVDARARDMIGILHRLWRSVDDPAPPAFDAFAVGAAVGPFFCSEIAPYTPRASMAENVWSVEWEGPDTAALSFRPGARKVTILLPVTAVAEQRERHRMWEPDRAADEGLRLLIAPFHSDHSDAAPMLTRREMVLAATVQAQDRRLFMSFLLSQKRGLGRAARQSWWSRLGDASGDPVDRMLDSLTGREGSPVQRLSRLSLAFGEGVDSPEEGVYHPSEDQIFRIMHALRTTGKPVSGSIREAAIKLMVDT